MAEIKRHGIQGDKSDIYKWIKINPSNQEIESLKFESMKTEEVNGNEINVRIFENAELRFDNFFAKFQYKNEGHIVMNCDTSEIPDIFLNHIEEYLDKN
ncbi:hypothetical protein [Halobacteriovorax marinus]|uniref:hypothetical protein n=1 Tax=Halobacteriovorax marinus TaxID=97084 RepID=UPI003A8D2862